MDLLDDDENFILKLKNNQVLGNILILFIWCHSPFTKWRKCNVTLNFCRTYAWYGTVTSKKLIPGYLPTGTVFYTIITAPQMRIWIQKANFHQIHENGVYLYIYIYRYRYRMKLTFGRGMAKPLSMGRILLVAVGSILARFHFIWNHLWKRTTPIYSYRSNQSTKNRRKAPMASYAWACKSAAGFRASRPCTCLLLLVGYLKLKQKKIVQSVFPGQLNSVLDTMHLNRQQQTPLHQSR